MTRSPWYVSCTTFVCLLLVGCIMTNPDANDNDNTTGSQNGNTNTNSNDNGDDNANDNTSSNDNGGGTAYVTFLLSDDNHAYRIEVRAGAEPENISTSLDALGTGVEDAWINISPDGSWLLLSTDRFDDDCAGWPCLAVVDADITTATTVKAAGAVIHPWAFSAIASSGDLIVYPDSGGAHDVDLWAIRRSGDAWGAPTLLTGDSTYPFNEQPAVSSDGSKVVFDAGPVGCLYSAEHGLGC
ncbi:MAG: hypothetical protein WBE26_04195 [Phycisphaerae bacterium]